MKRILLIIVCLALCLAVCTASADDISSALTAAPWVNGPSVITFQADGTGTFVNSNEKSFDMTWSAEGSTVSFEYKFYGKRQETLTLLEGADGLSLVSADGTETWMPAGTEKEKESNAYAVGTGEEIDLGFINFKLTGAELARGLTATKGGRFLNNKEGSTYYIVTGDITNTGKETIQFNNILCEMDLDGYIYSADVLAFYDDRLVDKLDPLCSGKLTLAAAVPDTLLEKTKNCQVTLALNDGLVHKASKVDSADFVFTYAVSSEQVAGIGANRETVWCEESPALMMPESFLDVNNPSHPVSTSGGKMTYCSYSYSSSFGDDVDTMMNEYYNGLKSAGYSLSGNAEEFTVSLGGKKLAEVSKSITKRLEVKILPGNEKLAARPGSDIEVPTEAPVVRLKLGETLRGANFIMTLEKAGMSNIIYSSIEEISGWHHYYEPEPGETFYYLFGSFTNNASGPLDMRHIYAEFIIDDNLHYAGNSAGVRQGSSDFITDLNAAATCKYYIYGSIPSQIVKKANSIVLKLGFTSDFNNKFVSNGGLPLFDHCDEVHEVILK